MTKDFELHASKREKQWASEYKKPHCNTCSQYCSQCTHYLFDSAGIGEAFCSAYKKEAK